MFCSAVKAAVVLILF